MLPSSFVPRDEGWSCCSSSFGFIRKHISPGKSGLAGTGPVCCNKHRPTDELVKKVRDADTRLTFPAHPQFIPHLLVSLVLHTHFSIRHESWDVLDLCIFSSFRHPHPFSYRLSFWGNKCVTVKPCVSALGLLWFMFVTLLWEQTKTHLHVFLLLAYRKPTLGPNVGLLTY